ncbi:hypothetical protein BKA70DRAFT_1417555 [Coprinopsis sp. MPI-PUGE-AT-0042]|nr:hypothetical protein BKA70DRAFT_1417555 [Coprinopsis sp. MPI-PUGE-AT-0042]
MASQVKLDLVEEIFNCPLIYDAIFSCLSPPDLYRAAIASRLLRGAVTHFHNLAYNINRHLSSFFRDPIALRKLQAKSGFLISGSNALQFLDRTYYPGSDLDLFAYPEHVNEIGEYLVKSEGYKFIPGKGQLADFSKQEVKQRGLARDHLHRPAVHNMFDYTTGMNELFRFKRQNSEVEVQVISTEVCPLDCILYFHSTCVMNFFTHIAAYSMYPSMTFDKRISLALGSETYERTAIAFQKYTSRGWSFPETLDHNSVKNMKGFLIYDTLRNLGDKHTWRVELDTQGLDLDKSSPFNSFSSANPFHCNTWTLEREYDGWSQEIEFGISYHIYRSPLLEDTYLIEGRSFREALEALEDYAQNVDPSMVNSAGKRKLDGIIPSLFKAHHATPKVLD